MIPSWVFRSYLPKISHSCQYYIIKIAFNALYYAILYQSKYAVIISNKLERHHLTSKT